MAAYISVPRDLTRVKTKLDKIGADREKARKKRDEWDAKFKDLDRRYKA